MEEDEYFVSMVVIKLVRIAYYEITSSSGISYNHSLPGRAFLFIRRS